MNFRAIKTRRGAWFAAAVAVVAVVGAATVNPRELYDQMYPVEALKRDVFRICRDTNSSFVRAFADDREQCFNSMPHAIALAIGWTRPHAITWADALRDPWREAELLLALAATPPRQAVVTPRSFADAESSARGLATGCRDHAAAAVAVPPGLAPGGVRGGARPGEPLAAAASGAGAVSRALPVVPLSGDRSMSMTMSMPASAPPTIAGTLSTPDIGDRSVPAIVPLPPTPGCSGGV